jgi:PD-(D/E)XK endonuclease
MARIRPRWRKRVPARRSLAQKRAAQARGIGILERGDLTEVAFLHKAMSLGFVVAKPYGHNHRYDFIVEGGKKLWRVQVKTSICVAGNLHNVSVRHSQNGVRIAYTEAEIDFVAVYLIRLDAWYILPVREVVGRTSFLFRGPNGKHLRDPWVHYLEAWHLLREPDGLTFG